MVLAPDDTHVLVLRIWREPRALPGFPECWRLSVEHVGTDRQRSLSDRRDIEAILEPILDRVGADLPQALGSLGRRPA